MSLFCKYSLCQGNVISVLLCCIVGSGDSRGYLVSDAPFERHTEQVVNFVACFLSTESFWVVRRKVVDICTSDIACEEGSEVRRVNANALKVCYM